MKNEKKTQMFGYVKRKNSDIRKNYSFLKKLGQGSFALIYLVQHRKSQEKRVVKKILKKGIVKGTKEQLVYEIDVLKNIDHPNIVKILEYY